MEFDMVDNAALGTVIKVVGVVQAATPCST